MLHSDVDSLRDDAVAEKRKGMSNGWVSKTRRESE
jgi:hypothetical protein